MSAQCCNLGPALLIPAPLSSCSRPLSGSPRAQAGQLLRFCTAGYLELSVTPMQNGNGMLSILSARSQLAQQWIIRSKELNKWDIFSFSWVVIWAFNKLYKQEDKKKKKKSFSSFLIVIIFLWMPVMGRMSFCTAELSTAAISSRSRRSTHERECKATDFHWMNKKINSILKAITSKPYKRPLAW